MKSYVKFLMIALGSSAISLSSAFAAEVPPSFADLVEKLTPAVVNISSTQKTKGMQPGMQMFEMPPGAEVPEEFRQFFEQFNKLNGGQKPTEREVYSLGSGFIIDENGYIATNNHVIADAEEVNVILSDDTKLKAKVIGRDTKTDLALLKVDAGKKLPFVMLGDSDASRVGDWVITIGNPYGLGGTVTAGIISARARNLNAGPFDDFIQTDAAINRGNSGGPMFNMKGEVIGINTAIFSPSGGSIGIGFAVPMAMAKPVLMQLKTTGHIDRGWLGVRIEHVNDEIADSVGLKKVYGALVMEVAKGSPSDKAGIVAGDIITSYDGKEIKEMRNLPLMVADTKIGKPVPIELWRNGQIKTVQVKIGEMKEDKETATENASEGKEQNAESAPKGKPVLGLSLSVLGSEERERHGLSADVKGVIITNIKPDSAALKRGLQAGDVITQIGDTLVSSPTDVSNAVASARKAGHKYVLLRIFRDKEAVFATLPLEEK